MHTAATGFLAATISRSRRATSGLTLQSAPFTAKSQRFLAAPKPPGRITASRSAALTVARSLILRGRCVPPRPARCGSRGSHLATQVIDHMHLRNVGGHAHRRRTIAVDRQQVMTAS